MCSGIVVLVWVSKLAVDRSLVVGRSTLHAVDVDAAELAIDIAQVYDGVDDAQYDVRSGVSGLELQADLVLLAVVFVAVEPYWYAA